MSSSEEFEIIKITDPIFCCLGQIDKAIEANSLYFFDGDKWHHSANKILLGECSPHMLIDRIQKIQNGAYKIIKRPKTPVLFRNEPEDRAFLHLKTIVHKMSMIVDTINGFCIDRPPSQKNATWIGYEGEYISEKSIFEQYEFINLATDETHPCDRSAMQVEWLR